MAQYTGIQTSKQVRIAVYFAFFVFDFVVLAVSIICLINTS